ncbi:DUF1553 domain-containing protein [Methylosinus sp. H3A]|nr:DUF1553 domain-containing protein [Methylosinus sp. H3A]
MMRMTKKTFFMSLVAASAISVALAADDGKSASAGGRTHWAYQPLRAPATPTVERTEWRRTPIDTFILAKLEQANLAPSPDADRATFIRRATLDVWGVIPTPEDVARFVKDDAPDAYEKLVDRLLASPHYGERQARRWLDLARYADSAGFQGDETRGNFYRYRDYVINAFNTDKPYSRFIREQIAGDELAPGDQEALTATGFLAAFPENVNARDLVLRKYQVATEITDTVGSVVLGTTIGCARCHNHKSDKFTQKDYFSLQAFFANTSVDERTPVAAPGEVENEFKAAQAKYDEAIRANKNRRKEIVEQFRDVLSAFNKERYEASSQAHILKPKEEWDAFDRWLNHRVALNSTDDRLGQFLRNLPADLYARFSEGGEGVVAGGPRITVSRDAFLKLAAEYKSLLEDLKKFDELRPKKGSNTITAVTELGHSDAPPTYILFGGNHERPLDEARPAFPEALTSEKPVITPTATSSGRRLALANWLVDSSNQLTPRVYVNRVWNEYFGKGIVGTVSDFGKAGDKPTHPELLDRLASDFVKEGWSVKTLHRQILLSRVYRQSSDYREDVAAVDPENKLLAVFPRKRLDAEQIRDSLLAASGRLDERIGGSSVFPAVPSNLNAGSAWEVSKDPKDHNRRSLYIFARRSVPYPLLEPFDSANTQQVHSKRDVTTTPLQALTLINSDIVFEWSQALAGRLLAEVGGDESAQFERLYEILFARKPDASEKALLAAFLEQQRQLIASKANDGRLSIALPTGGVAPTQDPLRASALVDLVHTVANSNEFIYRF